MLFIPQEKGQGLVEYALIIVLVVLVVVIVVTALGESIRTNFYERIVQALPGG